MKRVVWLALFLLGGFCFAARSYAGTLHLKNGDQLNGTFEWMSEDKWTFKEATVGKIEIKTKEIEQFKSDVPVWVILANHQTKIGTLVIGPEGWSLVSGTGSYPLKQSDVIAIYPMKKYTPKALNGPARPWLGWEGTGNLGYSLQHSTQRSTSFTAGVTASRPVPNLPGLPPHRRTDFSFSASFLSVTASPGVTSSNNTLSASLTQNFFFGRNQHNFSFIQADIDHIQPLQLYLRQTYGGGLGRDIIRHEHLVLSVRGGLTYVRGRFTVPPIKHSMEALAGEKFSWSLAKHLSLVHEFDFYPSITSAGDYRFDTVTSLDVPVSTRLSFQLGFIDHYLSYPPPIVTLKTNDVILSTGLGFNF